MPRSLERIEKNATGKHGWYGYGVEDGKPTRKEFLQPTPRAEAAARRASVAWVKANPIVTLKGVIRIEQPEKNSLGWQGRVNAYGEHTSKFFSDKKAGGSARAWLLCAKWVRREHQRLGKPVIEHAQVFTVARSSTGIVGVFRQASNGRLGIRVYVQRKAASRMLPEGTTLEQAARARQRWYRQATKAIASP